MIQFEQWPPRELGGQHVGTGSNGIKATHYVGDYPSGINAFCEHERSQHKNKRIAQEMIEWACSQLGLEP